ncbi:protein VACUOLELESS GAMETOPHYTES [Malania oleifera]|uniref:protein VACUOLELESS GAMETOPHYTES n=1 Tax=Malania oleifera TaxID=397392 RepID=UPI0025AD9E8D|nr:protein VACUOLELESS GAMETOPHYTES [Malania oleifera]
MNKSIKKSGTFVLKKTPSMKVSLPPSLDLALPTSFHPIVAAAGSGEYHQEGQYHHISHPQHPLARVSSPYLFTCMGCKEYGAGAMFSCQSCNNFQLHEFCALALPTLTAHSLHSHHQLVFHSKPVKGGLLWPRCDVCSKPIRGFAYRCSTCSFQMHPCCAMLSAEMKIRTHPHPMKLIPTNNATLSSSDLSYCCGECDKKRSGKVYRCSVCDYHIHAVCAKNMVNGLHANGIQNVEKPSMLGAAAKLASHVVVGFIGGLIEGIGEGVGEVLVQSLTKAGRRNNTSTATTSAATTSTASN